MWAPYSNIWATGKRALWSQTVARLTAGQPAAARSGTKLSASCKRTGGGVPTAGGRAQGPRQRIGAGPGIKA